MSVPLSIFLIGGHGRVAQLFTRHAAEAGHTVVSQIRNADHAKDLPMPSSGTGKVVPLVESLEALSVSRLAELLRDHAPNVVVFSAGAGGKGGPRRTQAVDRDGAIKVFDALEKSGIAMDQRRFRRFLLVSAVDVRNTETTKPSWYSEDDFATSERMRDVLGPYMQAKYEADMNLSRRGSFPWTVLRPSALKDEPAGPVSLAERKSISVGVPRESVAKTLLALAELPVGTSGANGMMWDLTAGNGGVSQQVQGAVERHRTDWLG